MNIIVSVSNTRIRELISEAGSCYWAKDLVFVGRSLAFTIIDHADKEEKRYAVTERMIQAGLAKMASVDADKGGHHFAAVRDWKSSDGWTGDAVIQFAIFGRLKYG